MILALNHPGYRRLRRGASPAASSLSELSRSGYGIRARHAAIVALSVLLAACPYPVPPGEWGRQNIGDAVPVTIVAGESRREDVLLMLGEPDGESNFQRHFMYYRAAGKGGIGLFMAAGGNAGYVQTERVRYRRLYVDFDDEGVVSHVEFSEKTCSETSGHLGQLVGGDPCVNISAHGPLTENPLVAADPDALIVSKVSWYADTRGLPGGFFARLTEPPTQFVQLVSTSRAILLFPVDADAETRPSVTLEHTRIADIRLERKGKFERILVVDSDGRMDGLEFYGREKPAAVLDTLRSRWQAARVNDGRDASPASTRDPR